MHTSNVYESNIYITREYIHTLLYMLVICRVLLAISMHTYSAQYSIFSGELIKTVVGSSFVEQC